ncbi:hypothetical protein Sliba_31970 [Streptomyces nigrescens]|uniref:Uncharacterized protein n=1 Tax=Streptomyces nigrescens TaxID=1920 RepID=A0A640THW2_STRNI|nr:hypothetical protein Sliba_31970 [Streptomyces libani subsp. libani]GGW07967.1 hypothetical protein GCM10010500_77760 [Streptomyces libani subsp. libani]
MCGTIHIVRAVKARVTAASSALRHGSRRVWAASAMSSGTHQTQWWDQLIGETSSAVTAVQSTPQPSRPRRR